MARAVTRTWLDFFLPAPCLGCGGVLADPGRDPGLCAPCRSMLRPAPESYCPHCGRPRRAEGAEQAPCGSCRRSRPTIDRLFWGWSYEPPLDAAIMAFKLARLDYLGDRLGRELAAEVGPRLPEVDGVCHVPLHTWRRLRRGFDQAEILARALGRELGLPFLPTLRRCRATPSQSRFGRAARRRNLRDAFALRRRKSLHGGRFLLVDDVVTTGATFEAAARALRSGGASKVYGLAVAFTPWPEAGASTAGLMGQSVSRKQQSREEAFRKSSPGK
ncbi:MAG: ComF family protein [Holophagales bacterium]|nr:ComF family protein [Holophagales bacterium]